MLCDYTALSTILDVSQATEAAESNMEPTVPIRDIMDVTVKPKPASLHSQCSALLPVLSNRLDDV